MSGIEEILQWAESQGLDDFGSISEAFDENGRMPLEEILGDEVDEFKSRLQGISFQSDPEPEPLSQGIQLPIAEPPQPFSVTERIRETVTSFINFFRSN